MAQCQDENPYEMRVDDEEDRSIPSEPLSGDKDQLIAQRDMVDRQARRRLFHSFYGPEASSQTIVPWSSPDSSIGTIWCIRIRRLHHQASLTTVLDMLKDHCAVSPDYVKCYETYQELDLTRTVDLGLRYPEDALWIWQTLHGVRVDDGCIEVHPLCKLHDPSPLSQVNSTSNCSQEERLKRVRAIVDSYEVWPKNGLFEENIACVFNQLSLPQEHDLDAREPSTEIKGDFNNHLIFLVADTGSSSD
jgi:hypothetical protein